MGYEKLPYNNMDLITEKVDLDLKTAAVKFIRNSCESLRFDAEKEEREKAEGILLGKSVSANQIPYNMQMDIERLCLENALKRFLDSGAEQDAFDVYFCYLEMFIDKKNNFRVMMEKFSEFESSESSLLKKHRDFYSHSVYVFTLGLAIYGTNVKYREGYKKFYGFSAAEEQKAAHHFLQFWGLYSLFRDIGYSFDIKLHPLEHMMIFCDELQCWDRASYERNSATELHPVKCEYVFGENTIQAKYLFDEAEKEKIGVLPQSNFILLYNLAVALNGRYSHQGQENTPEILEKMENEFESLSLEYKLLNIGQVKAFAGYLDAVGCFYTDRPVNLEMITEFTAEDMQIIGPLEHGRWLRAHREMGWRFGDSYQSKAEREQQRLHKCMMDEELTEENIIRHYQELSEEEQGKDYLPMNTMLKLLKLYKGVRIYRL